MKNKHAVPLLLTAFLLAAGTRAAHAQSLGQVLTPAQAEALNKPGCEWIARKDDQDRLWDQVKRGVSAGDPCEKLAADRLKEFLDKKPWREQLEAYVEYHNAFLFSEKNSNVLGLAQAGWNMLTGELKGQNLKWALEYTISNTSNHASLRYDARQALKKAKHDNPELEDADDYGLRTARERALVAAPGSREQLDAIDVYLNFATLLWAEDFPNEIGEFFHSLTPAVRSAVAPKFIETAKSRPAGSDYYESLFHTVWSGLAHDDPQREDLGMMLVSLSESPSLSESATGILRDLISCEDCSENLRQAALDMLHEKIQQDDEWQGEFLLPFLLNYLKPEDTRFAAATENLIRIADNEPNLDERRNKYYNLADEITNPPVSAMMADRWIFMMESFSFEKENELLVSASDSRHKTIREYAQKRLELEKQTNAIRPPVP